MAVVSFSFSTSEPELADQILEETYRPDGPVVFHQSAAPFTFSTEMHQVGDLHAGRMRHSMFTSTHTPPVDDLVVGTLLGQGSLWCGTGGAMPVSAVAGDVLLYPTDHRIDLGWDELDVGLLRVPMTAVVQAAVEGYADDHYRRGWGAVGPKTLRRAALFIEEHFGERLSLSDVARAVDAEPAALRHEFRLNHHLTPMEYLQRVRIEVAHRELELGGASQDETVADVAARSGFLSVSIFTAAYARRFGVLPEVTLRRGRESW